MVAEEIMARERSVLDNTRQSNTFSKAAWFLCADDHQKIKDLYAFFRLLDDLVDEAPGGQKGLELATKYLECVMDTADPIGDPGLARVRALGIPAHIWLEFLGGLQFDANNNNHNNEKKVDLDLYANQVAGTVGEAVMYALGLTEYCQAGRVLGTGLQRINICRDVQKDYSRNRYYISPCQKKHVLAHASRLIDESLSKMEKLPWRYRLAFTLAAKCYEAMGYGKSRIVAGFKSVASCIYPACYSGLQDVTRFYHTQIQKKKFKQKHNLVIVNN
jgi:phytoene/squalene synthetase